MIDKRIHSRTLFYVSKSPLSSSENFYNSLVNAVGQWLKRYSTTEVIFRKWLYRGGTIREKSIRIEVRVKDYNETTQSASVWVLRLEHKDSKFPQRIWRTDVAFTFINENEARVSISVHWSLRSDFLGSEPPYPDISTPNLVKIIVDSENFICKSSGIKLTTKAKLLTVGDGRNFFRLIQANDRYVPIILINLRDYKGEPFADGLQNLVVGGAFVYYYNSPVVHEEIQNEWGQKLAEKYQCGPDTIRIYQTRVNLKSESDFLRHRYFLVKDYSNRSKELLTLIVQGILRLSAHSIREGFIHDFETLFHSEQYERLQLLKKASEGIERSEVEEEYIKALEEENMKLEHENKQQLRQIADLEETVISHEITVSEMEKEIEMAKDQFKQFALVQRHYKDIESSQNKLRESWRNFPSSLGTLFRLFTEISKDRIVSLDEAFTSADKSEFRNLEEAWGLFMAMVEELYDLLFGNFEGNIESAFLDSTGYSLTLKEGSMTKSDNKLMALRKRMYNGNEVDISPHLKLDKSGRSLRVHYYADHERKLIVIGHCGDHLKTAGTARRGEG